MIYIHLFFKRFFDIVLSLLGIIILIPVWIIVPIAIKCDSKGPVLFKQERRTKNGKIFKIWKYRSMVVNAEKTGAGLFNYEDDPRVTKVGRFLRKSSIDELPQLFNILFGQMSIVGPRPCVKYELGDYETLNQKYKKRFKMKSGLTGWAQIKGRNDIYWDKKVVLDNEYIDRFRKLGVLIDAYIILMTALKVFKKENIYENKIDETMSDVEAAQLEEQEIIRIAHLPDEK